MELTNRQTHVLDLILGQTHAHRLGDLARALGVSTRTVHRELASLAPVLLERFRIRVSTGAGQGIHLLGLPEDLEACRKALMAQEHHQGCAPEDRRRILAAILLASGEGSKLFALTRHLGVSTAVVRHDLDLLRPWFASLGLELVLRRGLGVALEGGEAQRRAGFSSLIMEQWGEAGILDLVRQESGEPRNPGEAHFLDEVVPRENFARAETALGALPRSSLPSMAPMDYLGLVVHLAVALARNARGASLPSPDPMNPPGATVLSPRDWEALADRLGLPSSPEPRRAEALALDLVIRAARPEQAWAPLLEQEDLETVAMVSRMIEAVEQTGAGTFIQDRLLRDGLVAHWGPAWYRIRNRLPIHNPLQDQIVAEYGELYTALSRALAWLFPKQDIPPEERAYLVLHFASSQARQGQAPGRYRALVVCSAGIGSAHMLASRIRTELPEIELVASLSWFDVRDKPRALGDILISTIPLPLDPGSYVLVHPLLDASGVAAIRDFMSRRSPAAVPPLTPHSPAPGNEGLELRHLKAMEGTLRHIIQILEHMECHQDCPAPKPGEERPWERLLSGLVDRLETTEVRDRKVVCGDLVARSADGGIRLPSSRILFLHARSSGIGAISLSIHRYSGPLAPEPGAPPCDRVVLMLAPRDLEPECRDLLNEISVSLLDSQTLDIIHQGDLGMIRAHYLNYLHAHYRRMTTEPGAFHASS